MNTKDVEGRQAEAMKILADTKKRLAQIGMEASVIARCPHGSEWPVLVLYAGQTSQDVEAGRNAGN